MMHVKAVLEIVIIVIVIVIIIMLVNILFLICHLGRFSSDILKSHGLLTICNL